MTSRTQSFLTKAEFSSTLSKTNLISHFKQRWHLSILCCIIQRDTCANASKFKLLSISTLRTHPKIQRLEIWLASFYLTFSDHWKHHLEQTDSQVEKHQVFLTDCTIKCIFYTQRRHSLILFMDYQQPKYLENGYRLELLCYIQLRLQIIYCFK